MTKCIGTAGHLDIGENIGGIISFVGAPVITELGEDNSSWGVNVDASSAAKALKVVATGSANNEVRWVATVRTVEVGF